MFTNLAIDECVYQKICCHIGVDAAEHGVIQRRISVAVARSAHQQSGSSDRWIAVARCVVHSVGNGAVRLALAYDISESEKKALRQSRFKRIVATN